MDVPNPHDEQLRRSWRLCRFGMKATADPERREKVLAWLDRMQRRFPGSPQLARWVEIVSGQAPELTQELALPVDFFALSPESRACWRPLVQSQPFSCLLPGRTTRERRAVLSRLP